MLLVTSAHAEDWPAWTGPHGTNRAIATRLPQSFERSSGKNVAWATLLGDVAFGCPTISDGRIYVGTNAPAVRDDRRFSRPGGGVLVCLDEATGETLWRLVSPERETGFPEHTHMPHQRWGICSSPAVVGNRVYIVTQGDDVLCLDVRGLDDGNDGVFQDEAQFMAGDGNPPIALEKKDADILWRYDLPRELTVAPHDVASCSPLVHDGVVYVSTSNGLGKTNPAEALMPEAPAFIALDAETGALIAVEDESISARLWHAQWSSPSKGIVDGRTLIFVGGGDGFCYAFEAVGRDTDAGSTRATGKLKLAWKFDCNPHHYKFTEAGDRIWYYKGDVRVLKNPMISNAGVNTGDGSFIGPSEVLATPVFHDGKVYIATGRDPMHGLGRGVLQCIDASGRGDITETGGVWRYEAIGRTMATVAIADGLVYVTDLAGDLHCLDALTGEVHWRHTTGEETWAQPLVADGKVYMNTRRSFSILRAGRKREVLFQQRAGSETGAIAANETLYLFTKRRLYALRQGATAQTDSDAPPAGTPEGEEQDAPVFLEVPEPESPAPAEPAAFPRWLLPTLAYTALFVLVLFAVRRLRR